MDLKSHQQVNYLSNYICPDTNQNFTFINKANKNRKYKKTYNLTIITTKNQEMTKD